MDTHTLVTRDDIELGEKVLNVLSSDPGLHVCAVLWMFNENLGQWIFTISTPYYEKHGAQAAYLRVRKLLERNSLLEKLPLERIAIISDDDTVLGLIRRLFGPAHGCGVRLTNIRVNGTSIPDVYFYQLSKRRAGARTKPLVSQ